MANDEAQLLLTALRTLTDEERERVLGWLLSRIPVSGEPFLAGELVPEPVQLPRGRRQFSVAGAQHQVVPMRFTSVELARLRAWSEEHGFSMAAVVRGVVSRFLDGQPDAGPKTQQGGSAEAEPP